MLLVVNTIAGSQKKLFDWFIFSYLLIIPLTRQVPYHQVISFGGTALLLIVYLIRKLLYGSIPRLPAPSIILTVGLYLSTILISSLFSNYIVDGIRQLVREIFFFIILVIIYDYSRSLRQWRTIVQVLIWCGGIAVISVIIGGILLFLSGKPLLGGEARVGGLFANPNVAGLLISVCFPVTISFLQWKKFLHVNHANTLIFIVTFLTFAAAILTVSRGLILGFFFSILALHLDVIWKIRYKLLLVTCSLFFIALVLGVIFVDAEMLASLNVSMRLDRGLAGRGFIWERAWLVFQENPLFGTGPGTFLYYILSPMELRPWGTVESIRYMYFHHGDMSLMYVPGIFSGVISNSAHNLWLDTAANTGAVGVFAVALIFLLYGWFAVNRLYVFRCHRQEPYYWVIRGCLVGLIAFFLRSQFEVSGLLRGALSESLPFWLTFLLVISTPPTVQIRAARKCLDGNE